VGTKSRLVATTSLVSLAGLAGVAALGGGLAAVQPLVAVVAVVAVALVGLAAYWPYVLRLCRESAWAVPAIIAILAILVDFAGVQSSAGPFRYSATALVAGVALILREPELIGARATRVTATLLFLYGVGGTLYGRIAYGSPDGALPVAAPLLLIVLGPLRPPVGDEATVRALKLLSVLGSAYALATVASYAALGPGAAPVYNHEKAFLIVLGFGTALAARSKVLMGFAVLAAGLAFSQYPAATYVVAALAGLLTILVVRMRLGALTRVAAAAVILPGTVLAVLHVDSLITFSTSYFAAVGKTNNGSTRSALYRLALDHIDRAPWMSDFFTGNLTVITKLAGQSGVVIPVHNDYLGAALGGGIVAAGLFIGIFLFANGLALRTLATVSPMRRRAIVALLASLNAAAVTAFANPVFMNPGSSVAVYSILIGLMTLCVRRKPAPRAPGDALTTRRLQPVINAEELRVEPAIRGASQGQLSEIQAATGCGQRWSATLGTLVALERTTADHERI